MSYIVHSFLIQAPSTCYSTITHSHLVNDWDGAKEKEMYRSEEGILGQSRSGKCR